SGSVLPLPRDIGLGMCRIRRSFCGKSCWPLTRYTPSAASLSSTTPTEATRISEPRVTIALSPSYPLPALAPMGTDQSFVHLVGGSTLDASDRVFSRCCFSGSCCSCLSCSCLSCSCLSCSCLSCSCLSCSCCLSICAACSCLVCLIGPGFSS